MTKFELPEKPKKTNTSEDFDNLRKAVDELDEFDYAWKTHANKADRRINAANKYIEELERENQRLIAENLGVKTLVDNASPQQALPVVPEFVAKWYEEHKDDLESSIYRLCIEFNQKVVNTLKTKKKLENWFDYTENKPIETLIRMQEGYEVEKPQLFYLKAKELLVVGDYDHVEDLWLDWNKNFTPKKQDAHKFTQEEIDSMETGSYEQIEVEK